ncbi:hypothetical protein EYF80_031495 [Liparis tanakae]|uniref:Uncharacterized protein n=1 Tax=Liparis tanakae TaxID=230148 RepID=A0A4Z2GYS8_9TELE|nr:hypothetical protein EYF80_031495 [Liparis tanakae]
MPCPTRLSCWCWSRAAAWCGPASGPAGSSSTRTWTRGHKSPSSPEP